MARTSQRVSSNEYKGAWWAGFRAGIYAEPDIHNSGLSNMTAIALAMEGQPIEQNSTAETTAYKRGYQTASEFKELFRLGKFPDLTEALRGGSVIGSVVDDTLSFAADVASDPLGELYEQVASIFE